MASEMDDLIRDLRKRSNEGVEVVQTSNGHLKVKLHGRVVGTLSLSPSDHRTVKNAYRNLVKAGIPVSLTKRRPPKPKKKQLNGS